MGYRMPRSMSEELDHWDIDLEGFVSSVGDFNLACGYAAAFWPRFEVVGRYIAPLGYPLSEVEKFERSYGDAKTVERVLNQIHVKDIQHYFAEGATPDKLIFLGEIMMEMLQAKIARQFPDRPCKFEFNRPDDPDDLIEYQISFWQAANEGVAV